jgi:hypothetical protein
MKVAYIIKPLRKRFLNHIFLACFKAAFLIEERGEGLN